jgi:hypothetical protein
MDAVSPSSGRNEGVPFAFSMSGEQQKGRDPVGENVMIALTVATPTSGAIEALAAAR